ncbi:MAG TPA: glycine cleavage system protein GcvH [Verrucomicrobiae bacterium]|nr:glycine cleavage system protein GcvH [Verrucomicrobiae bacterium]
MSEWLELTYDKFIFRVKADCLYRRDDYWARIEGNVATVGVADYRQKASGDVAFLEAVAAGTDARQGAALGVIETIKTTAEILSPVTGRVVEVNPDLETSPFLINEDPYGKGWIYRIEMADPQGDRGGLLDAHAYLELLKQKVAVEGRKLYGQS